MKETLVSTQETPNDKQKRKFDTIIVRNSQK